MLTLVSCWPPGALVLKTVQIHATNSNNKRKWLKTSPVSAKLTIFTEPYKCVINTSSFKAINLSHPNPSQETNPREEPICRAIAERQAVRKPMQKFASSMYSLSDTFCRQKSAGFAFAVLFHSDFTARFCKTCLKLPNFPMLSKATKHWSLACLVWQLNLMAFKGMHWNEISREEDL